MLVAIHSADDAPLGEARAHMFYSGHRCVRRLRPDTTYWLRLWREPDEPVLTWDPQPRDDLTVLEFSRRPAVGEVKPAGALELICRMKFEVYNDALVRRISRWGFRSSQADQDDDDNTWTTWRLPLEVLPRRSPSVIVALTFAVGVWVGATFDLLVSLGSGRDAEMQFGDAMWTSMLLFVAVFLVGLGTLRLLGVFWVRAE
ncbi:MAG: hypothetical protein AB7K09_23045 [Planctomycetota bacterium]